MDVTDLLDDALGRLPERAHEIADSLSADQLNHRLDDRANSIAWLLWHTARVVDAQVSDVAGEPERWPDWRDRLGLDLGPSDTGYGHDSDQVARVRVEGPELLTGYLDDAVASARRYVAGLDAAALDRVVDDAWDPPVTLGVRLISVVDDAAQHLGQAGFAAGLL